MNYELLSVTNIMPGTSLTLPSSAALASRDWHDVNDHATIKSNDNDRDMTVALILFKNIRPIFRDPRRPWPKLITHVLNLSMWPSSSSSNSRRTVRANGRREDADVTVTLERFDSSEDKIAPPTIVVACVQWSHAVNNWTTSGCHLKSQNATHGVCQCDRLSSYALAYLVRGGDYGDREGDGEADAEEEDGHGVVLAIVLAVILGIVLVAALSAAVAFAICYQRRHAQHKPLKESSLVSGLCLLPCCCQRSGDSSREGTHSPDFSFQGQIVHQDSPTFTHNNQREMMHLPLQTMQLDSNGVHMNNFNTCDPRAFQHGHPSNGNCHQQHPLGSRTSTRPYGNNNHHNRWQLPTAASLLKPSNIVQTPERPLLTDFPSPGQISNQHIYMEVNNYEPWASQPNASNCHQPPPPPQRGTFHYPTQHHQQYPDRGGSKSLARSQQQHHHQQQQQPLLQLSGIDSSCSSQSSGYGSALSNNGNNNNASPSVFAISHDDLQRRQRPSTLFNTSQRENKKHSKQQQPQQHRQQQQQQQHPNWSSAAMEDSQII